MCRWRPPSADRGRRRGRTWHAPSAGQGGGATCPFFRSPSKLRRIAQRKGAAAAGEEVLVQGGAGLAVIGDILRVGQILDGEAQGAEAGLVAGIEVEQRVAVEIGGIEAGCVLEIAIEKSRRLQAQRESIARRSEEHTSELQSLMRIPYA